MSFNFFFPSVRFFIRRLNYGITGIRTYCAKPAKGGATLEHLKCGIVCCYEDNGHMELTPAGVELDVKSGGKISKKLNGYAKGLKLGNAFVLTDILDYRSCAISSIGPKNAGFNELESLDEARENIRWGVGAGMVALAPLADRDCQVVEVDPCTAADAAAEAAYLARHRRCPVDKCNLYEWGLKDSHLFEKGKLRGRTQNSTRDLCDMAANMLTPTNLAQEAINRLCPKGITVEAHDREWIEAHGMQAFLAVAQGSCEPPMFVECHYHGASKDKPPVLLVAKGLTFDSGGLCLKSCQGMTESRASMAGAAVVIAAMGLASDFKLPINVTAVIPMCENMVSGQCMKVGDVVQALNGKSIRIENTDMEGGLMMADALVYGQSLYKPSLVIDVATLSHGVVMATGDGAFGCFSNSERAWLAARCAGAATGDRPWRLPLWDYFQKQITNDPSVDLRNQGSGHATPCIGAAFLKNFVCTDWLHMDITGVGKIAHSSAPPYLDPRRMSGRPIRTLSVLLEQLAAAYEAKDTKPNKPNPPQCPQQTDPCSATSPQPRVPSTHAGAPKPQTSAASTQTSPNPQIGVPSIKHKCN